MSSTEFFHHEFFPVGKGDDRIWRGFQRFDVIGVKDEFFLWF